MSDTNALADQLEALADGIGDCVAVAHQLRGGAWHGTANLVEQLPAIITALRATDDHPTAEDYFNRAQRAEQALAERDALLDEAAQIIGQIELDQRYPPAPDSMERRIERARDWLARAAKDAAP